MSCAAQHGTCIDKRQHRHSSNLEVSMGRVDVAVMGAVSPDWSRRPCADMGWQPVVLEAADRPAGSWPRYYDSLTLFSPARCGSLPEMPFDGDLDRCPHRDVVITCLLRYTDRLDADIRTRTRVLEVSYGDGAFGLSLEDGSQLEARAAVAATGAFGRLHRPDLPGLAGYAGAVLHSANYRSPEPFTGQRVVVVGAGNSAVQRAAECARVTPAARHAVRFARQRTLGRYLHLWLARTGLDTQAVGRFLSTPPTQPVIDDGRYRGGGHRWATGSAPAVHRHQRNQGHPGRRRRRGCRHDPPCHRLPTRSGPSCPARHLQHIRTPPPPRGRPARTPGIGPRRSWMAAQPAFELSARSGPGRRPGSTARRSPSRPHR
ncbi:NAD(P)-binding domain-containing protein [Streptomyces sp. NPDC048558]|uniref:NAD(P)-binding domain-containing protein n=1 Tax=Streptomyces sp. NPDC048558 TaxID=3155759 RepID=UPI0033E8F27A